jgi:hypothetical protein
MKKIDRSFRHRPSARFASGLAKTLVPALLLSAFGATAAMAQDQAAPAPAAPASAAMTTPAMSGPLSANPNPFYVDTSDWLGDAGGKIYIGGAVTGLGYYQSNPTRATPGDASSYLDLDNAQVTIQKTDGWLQFYVQAGDYALPSLGSPYIKSSTATSFNFGVVPVAYLKLQGEDALSDFSVEAGKLPTLIGDEYTFTFENMNIERGLLWNLEPAVSRGVQFNYANGPLSVSVSWNDGFYSNNLNWLDGLVSYVFSPADTLAVAGGGNLGGHNGSLLNQGDVFNLIWTHTMGNWVISPYLQFIQTPSYPPVSKFIPGTKATEDFAEAILASYSVDDNFKLAGRFEYENSSGHNYIFTPVAGGLTNAPNILGYGAGSDAWSLTFTPTYQWKLLFARLDLSYVGVSQSTAGSDFGSKGTAKDQTRVMVETGVVF